VIPPTGCYDPGNVAGAFHAQRAMRPRDFHDGLSSTAFYSERVLGDHDPDVYDPWRDYVRFVGNGLGMDVCTPDQMIADCRDGIAPGAPHASYVGVTWLFGGWVQTAYNHILTPNSPIPDCAYDSEQFPNGGHAAMTARSHHPGGVNVVFGDAHVEFVSQQVDLGVWREMSTRAGTLPGSTF
jgi:prepilin-type processing-associated H-X9-DG protein